MLPAVGKPEYEKKVRLASVGFTIDTPYWDCIYVNSP